MFLIFNLVKYVICVNIFQGEMLKLIKVQETLLCLELVNRAEIRNSLDNLKTDLLGNLSEQLGILKKKIENVALSIFCPKCRKKHAFERISP